MMAGRSDFTQPGTALVDLEIAWQDRLAEGKVLLAANHHAWAMATGLYALEIRLKVLICKRLRIDKLPRAFEIHDLDGLLLLSGLSNQLLVKKASAVRSNWNSIINESRSLNEFRYGPASRWNGPQATQFYQNLEDLPDGVFPWQSRSR